LHGFFAAQGFFAAHGLRAAHGFRAAQGFLAAQGLAATNLGWCARASMIAPPLRMPAATTATGLIVPL
jgi:hypothetical protein